MLITMKKYIVIALLFFVSCQHTNTGKYEDMATLAKGWRAEVIATIDQSYAGWDV